jgi:hypothetical protein
MSPEQSSKRASIYEKLALKDKLESNKQRQSLLLLSEELKKNRQIETQISSLIEQNNNEVGTKTGMTLQTASWFNTKVRDQLELVQNRCQHLEIEIGEMRKKLAYAERRRVRKTEKAEALYKQARQTRQDRQDAALSERGRRPRIR